MRKTQFSTARRWRIGSDELPMQFQQQQGCLHQSLPENFGRGHTNIFHLDQDLSYMETEYTPTKDLVVLSKMECDEPRLTVALGVKGNSCFASSQGDEVVFKEGCTTITAFNSSLGERQYAANKHIRQLRFSMSKKWLGRFLSDDKLSALFNRSGVRQVSCLPISAQGSLAVRQLLLANTVSKAVRPLFMQAQAMSLLATELNHLWAEKPVIAERFTQKDREMAMMAQDILAYEFKTPPTVDALSKRVGTNSFKLKKLFHHFFNTTPYGLLLDIRMKNAYQLLESTHCHVSVAAYCVGYNYVSNFSTAFIKHFGISPKLVARK